LEHLSRGAYNGAATAESWREFNGQARDRGGVRVVVDRKGFGAGSRKPKRPDLGVLQDHRLKGKTCAMWAKKYVARSAGASMSAFEIRPKRPPHSSFFEEVYIFALSAAVATRGNKKNGGGRTLTTERQGAKSRDGREQEPFRKSIQAPKMIDERAGVERSWRYTFLKIYILYRKSIYIFKKLYLRNPVNTRCKW
jgi:hypothetical protein